MYRMCTKNKKDTQFFAKLHPWVWRALPKTLCNNYGMSFTLRFCHSSGHVYSYFEKGCWRKMCMRQSRKVIWDMINTLFLTLAVELTFFAFL